MQWERRALVGDEALLHTVAEKLRTRIAAHPIDGAGVELCLTSSIGGALLAAGDSDFDAAVRRADRGLYAAKQDGRDCVRLDTGD